MREDAISSLISFDKKRALDVVQKDEIDRFASYAARHILGSLNHRVFKAGDDPEPEKLAVHLVIATTIQNAANCAREIASQALQLDAPVDERNALELARINEIATGIFDSAILSFFKRDCKAAEKTIETAKRFSDPEREFLEMLISSRNGIRSEELVALVSTLGSLKKIVRYASDISAQVLGLSTEQFVEIEDGRRVPKRVIMNEVLLVTGSYEI
jgi:hypothetical protein